MDSPVPSATYADGNRLATTTNAAGNVTTYNYNPQTNVLESVQYPNFSGTYTYDTLSVAELPINSIPKQ